MTGAHDPVSWLREQIEADLRAALIISDGGFGPQRWDTDPPGMVNPYLLSYRAALDAAIPGAAGLDLGWTAIVSYSHLNTEPPQAATRDDDVPVMLVDNGRREVDHVTRHDPRNVAADCEAKLAILDEHELLVDEFVDRDGIDRVSYECAVCVPPGTPDQYPCRTVRTLASAYRHRPGYADHWEIQWTLIR